MTSVPDFTVVVAVDEPHLEELRLSFPTWARHKPDLLRRPWAFLCDPATLREADWWRQQLAGIVAGRVERLAVYFPPLADARQVDRRHRMLSTLVVAARWIETPYYLKLDTDAVATGAPDWINPVWFGGGPAIIAPPWGYTKPASMLDDFDRWAAGVPAFAGTAPTARKVFEGGSKAFHRRIISYCMFGQTDFTFRMASLVGGELLPIPSQDTFLCCCADRLGEKVLRVRMPGWRHIGGGGERLRVAASAALAAG